MKYLLDSHLLLWAANGSPRLPRRARGILSSDEHELWFSAVTIWEVTIKSTLKKFKDFTIDVPHFRRGLLRAGFLELPITGAHALEISRLDAHHGDPFDRLLVAQAVVERMQLLTSDQQLSVYPNTELVR